MKLPQSNIKIFSKRNFRIIRIWWFGKLPYTKRLRKWMNGQLLRDLQNLTPRYMERYVEKYGGEANIFWAEGLNKSLEENNII